VGGFIFLPDGRAYAPASWAYDTTLRSIADALGQTPEDQALRVWLDHQTCAEQGMGLGSVDVRELAPSVARRFIEAIPEALAVERAKGSDDWHDPSFFPGWLKRFEELQAMVEAADRGEPLEALNPYARDPASPWPGEPKISGPGWPEWLRAAPPDELGPLADRIETVDWSDTPLSDEDLAQLAKLPRAQHVFIHRTGVTPAGLPHLAALSRIESLWTQETGISDEALEPLRERFPGADIRGEGWIPPAD